MPEPNVKNRILEVIYAEFEKWSSQEKFCCHAGCSTCCTRNVTITALEGQRILDFCIKNNLRAWMYEKLSHLSDIEQPQQTTNEYILDVLENEKEKPAVSTPKEICPFLENHQCGIYPVRPFSCRCFSSEKQCRQTNTAIVVDHYLYGSLAVMQIIEHLGQFEYWGYMTDVLQVLIKSDQYQTFSTTTTGVQHHLKNTLLRAHPLPGFITIGPGQERIDILLNSIFTHQINDTTVEKILNGD